LYCSTRLRLVVSSGPAIADGEAKVTALSPAGRFDVCSVVVGMAAEKYESEADLADELKLPDPYVAVRLNKLA